MFNCFRFVSLSCLILPLHFFFSLFPSQTLGRLNLICRLKTKTREKKLLIAQKFRKTDLGRRDGMWTRGKMLVAGGKRNAFHETKNSDEGRWQGCDGIVSPITLFSLWTNRQVSLLKVHQGVLGQESPVRPEECGERNLWNSLSRGWGVSYFHKGNFYYGSCRLGKGMDWKLLLNTNQSQRPVSTGKH